MSATRISAAAALSLLLALPICVAAALLVLLVLGKPLAEVERIALDENSRNSAGLVKILCADRWGITPSFVEARPDLDEMLAHADAALPEEEALTRAPSSVLCRPTCLHIMPARLRRACTVAARVAERP